MSKKTGHLLLALSTAVIIVCIGLPALGAFRVSREYAGAEARDTQLRRVTPAPASMILHTPTPQTEPTPTPSPSPTPKPILPQYEELYRQNSDLAGWLCIDGTVIDYPVMYTPEDQNYYLHLDFDKNESVNGTLFIQEPWHAGNNNTIIHGHHMKDGSMFGGLDRYADETYGREHSILRFDSLTEEGEYELVAAFYSQVYDEEDGDDVFRYYDYPALSKQKNYEYYVAGVKAAALYDTGITPEYGEQLITLSTCEYHVEDGRFVVVARRINTFS